MLYLMFFFHALSLTVPSSLQSAPFIGNKNQFSLPWRKTNIHTCPPPSLTFFPPASYSNTQKKTTQAYGFSDKLAL